MKIPFYVSVASSALSLVLSIIIFTVGNSNQSLQTEVQKQQLELQKQQEQINTGNQISQQVGPNLLRDMATSSVKNEKMKALLAKHGYNVEYKPPASPAPGASAPAPARPAAAPASESAPRP
jgi:ribosomal protein S16